MANFTLRIEFSPADLEVIALAGELLTIVNRVSTVVTSGSPSLKRLAAATAGETVWTAFSPLESNVVAWSEDYEVYASYTTDNGNAVITQTAVAPAVSGKTLALLPDGVFGSPQETPPLPVGAYGISNQFPGRPFLTFGIGTRAQPTVNGQHAAGLQPMSASVVPLLHTAQFSPPNSLQVFLQSGTYNGMQLPNEIDVQPLHFGPDRTDVVIRYNSRTARFDIVS